MQDFVTSILIYMLTWKFKCSVYKPSMLIWLFLGFQILVVLWYNSTKSLTLDSTQLAHIHIKNLLNIKVILAISFFKEFNTCVQAAYVKKHCQRYCITLIVFLTPLPEELKEHLDYQAALHTGVNRMIISLVDQPTLCKSIKVFTHNCSMHKTIL